ncbi:MAG: hypothetical protein RIS21_745 [Planctomycetota bacterium]
MSSKTTVVLFLLLLAVVAAVKWTRRDAVPVDPSERRLVPAAMLRDAITIRFRPGESRTPKSDPYDIVRDASGTWRLESAAVLGGKSLPARADRCLWLVDVLRDAAFVRTLGAANVDNPGAFGLLPTQGDVIEVVAAGSTSSIVFGFDVDGNGIAVRRGKDWPPVVVDKSVLEEARRPAAEWWERRMVAADSADVRAVTLVDGSVRTRLVRESGRWLIAEPVIGRADPARAERLAALAVTVAARDGTGVEPPASAAKIDVVVEAAGKPPATFHAAVSERRMWLRRFGETSWAEASSEAPDVFSFRADDFRSRRVFPVEVGDLTALEWKRPGSARVAFRRIGGQWFYEPPEDSGWTDLSMKRPLLALDGLTGPRFIESVLATEVEGLHPPKPIGDRWTVAWTASKGGADTTRGAWSVGDGADGAVLYAAEDGAFGTFRKNGLSAFDVPWWSLLAKPLNATAPWSITEVEVTDSVGRKVSLRAVSAREGGFDYVLATPESPEGRPAPRERVDAVLGRIASLAARRFVGMNAPQASGLSSPRLVVRWRDTIQRSERELVPNPKSGRWYTWRIGADDGEGGVFGDYPESLPGLCFTTEARDLDPFLDLLAPP